MPTLEQASHNRTAPPQRGHPAVAYQPQASIRAARTRLRPLIHPPEHYDGIPYFDEEFDMAQSIAHSRMVYDLGQYLHQLAPTAGLQVLSDNPVWYWVAATEQQKPFYPDYALADDQADHKRITALSLRLVIELVSTASPAKEQKDSVRMRELNAANGVPEFILFYPESEDERAVRWFSLDDAKGGYREWDLPADRRYRSQSVPGLEVEVLPPETWQPGRKARLWYRGDRLPTVDEAVFMAEQEHQARAAAERQAKQAIQQSEQERQARETAERQAEQEHQARAAAERQAKQAIQQSEQERQARETAERQAKRAIQQSEQERQARETTERQVEQERQARETAERQARQVQAENARLLARLREAGLTP